MPYYIQEPKRDHNFDNYPYIYIYTCVYDRTHFGLCGSTGPYSKQITGPYESSIPPRNVGRSGNLGFKKAGDTEFYRDRDLIPI